MQDDIKDTQPMFDYLSALRESGDINMFEAVPYLKTEFDLSTGVAMRILKEWMTAQTRDRQYEE